MRGIVEVSAMLEGACKGEIDGVTKATKNAIWCPPDVHNADGFEYRVDDDEQAILQEDIADTLQQNSGNTGDEVELVLDCFWDCGSFLFNQ